MDYASAVEFLNHSSGLGGTSGERTVARVLLEKAGCDYNSLHYVHIAGTNGKGSTSALTASILQAAGYKVGLYTSPYINRFNERIQINGEPIPDDVLAEMTTQLAETIDAVVADGSRPPIMFERITALGLQYFVREKCDVVVLEVGLGGRLDATNIIACPDAAVIANIGLDHMKTLGDTVEKIAFEKAGIIKPGCDTVLYQQSESVMDVVRGVCKEKGAKLHIADNENAVCKASSIYGTYFDYGGYKDLFCSLPGKYQVCNAVTAIKAVEVLISKGWKVSEENIRTGLANTAWPGRVELMHEDPIVIADGAHNPQGAEALMGALDFMFPGKKITFIMGTLADKDYERSISLAAGLAKRFYTVSPPSHRALSSDELAERLKSETSLDITACDCIEDAVKLALSEAGKDDVICAFGSLYQIGDIRNFFGKN